MRLLRSSRRCAFVCSVANAKRSSGVIAASLRCKKKAEWVAWFTSSQLALDKDAHLLHCLALQLLDIRLGLELPKKSLGTVV